MQRGTSGGWAPGRGLHLNNRCILQVSYQRLPVAAVVGVAEPGTCAWGELEGPRDRGCHDPPVGLGNVGGFFGPLATLAPGGEHEALGRRHWPARHLAEPGETPSKYVEVDALEAEALEEGLRLDVVDAGVVHVDPAHLAGAFGVEVPQRRPEIVLVDLPRLGAVEEDRQHHRDVYRAFYLVLDAAGG